MNKGIKRTVLFMTITGVGVKTLGLFRDVVLARYYGAGSVSDAYLIAMSVPTLLFYFIGHAISTAYMPIYAKAFNERGEERANLFSNNLICVSMVMCTIIVAVLTLFPKPVLMLFAPGFDVQTMSISALITRISAPSIYCMTLVSISSSFLHYKGKFLITTTISVPRNLFLIASVAISYYMGYSALGIGILFAYIGEFALVLPSVLKNGHVFRVYFDPRDEYLKQAMSMIGPIILGVAVSQINKMIDKSMASTIIVGGVSALNYAAVINNSIQEITITSIITVLFAKLTTLVASGHHAQVKEALYKSMSSLNLILIPITAGIVLLARPIVVLLYQRGSFGEEAANLTCASLQLYAIGILFMAQSDMMVKVFYAYRDTRTPTVTAALAIVVNIVLNLVLSRFMGISGLALATSISGILRCTAMYIMLRRKIGDFGTRAIVRSIVKITVAAGVMALYTSIGYQWLASFMKQTAATLVTIFVSAIIYLIMCHVLNIDVLKELAGRDRLKKSEAKAS